MSERKVPIEVTREISKHCGLEKSDRVRHIQQHEKAYVEMMDLVEGAEIPEGEKEAILKNVAKMAPGNYIRQKAEAKSMVETVLNVIKNNK